MKIDQPLLSVIVPCYNVEKYLDKSISSIAGQKYVNLEILLVNDGSTDETGAICDSWQKKDSRIKVIHKQNEGPSYARKTGVENASAEYITFVDADDWIDENMYHNMMTALLSTNSDIAQCGVCDAYEDGRIKHRSREYKDGSFEIVDKITGVLFILEEKEWLSYMWNKIFKKHLFENIEFPKGRRIHEDVSIVHILFNRATQTVYLRDEYYFYLQRSCSITNSYHIADSKMKNFYDTYNAFYERYCFVKQHPEYHRRLIFAKNRAISHGVRVLRHSIIRPQYFPEDYSNSVEKQLHTIEFIQKDILKEFLSPLMRLELFIFLSSPACYKMLVKLYARIGALVRR